MAARREKSCIGSLLGSSAPQPTRGQQRYTRAPAVQFPQSSLTAIPAAAIRSLAWRIVYSPKWKIEAASTALA